VLDAQCRLHDVENCWVVDGSFMPTSLGVGPALTIVANALRVAAHVAKE
jgi:choline dehydrogenase-like flavoprotein